MRFPRWRGHQQNCNKNPAIPYFVIVAVMPSSSCVRGREIPRTDPSHGIPAEGSMVRISTLAMRVVRSLDTTEALRRAPESDPSDKGKIEGLISRRGVVRERQATDVETADRQSPAGQGPSSEAAMPRARVLLIYETRMTEQGRSRFFSWQARVLMAGVAGAGALVAVFRATQPKTEALRIQPD